MAGLGCMIRSDQGVAQLRIELSQKMLGGCGGLNESETEAYEAQETARLQGKYGMSADTQAAIAAVAQLRRSAHTHWRIASELDAKADSVETALLAAPPSLNNPPSSSSSSSSSSLNNLPSSPLFNNSKLVSPLSSTTSTMSASAAAKTLASQVHKTSSQKHSLSYADFINTQHNRASRARANDSFWSQQAPSSNKPPHIHTYSSGLVTAHTPESLKRSTDTVRVKRVRSLSVIQPQQKQSYTQAPSVAPLPPHSTRTYSSASSGHPMSNGAPATRSTEDVWIQRSLSHTNNKRHTLSYPFSPSPVLGPALQLTHATQHLAPDHEHHFKNIADATSERLPTPRVDPLPETLPQSVDAGVSATIVMRKLKASLPASRHFVGIGQNGSIQASSIPTIPSTLFSGSNSNSSSATGKGVQQKGSILSQWRMRNPFMSK